MKRILLALAGVVALLVGLGFIMPAVALFRSQGALSAGNSTLLLLGCLMALGGIVLVGTGIRRRIS